MNTGQRRSPEDSDARTRGKLIEATQQLLATGGAHALTSRAIASAADANLASITYYFGSKEQLVTESMIAAARELLAPVVTTLSSDGEATLKMLESVVLLNRILDEHRDDLTAYLQVLAASPTNPSIAAAVQALHRDMAHLLADQINVQRAAGQLPSWVSPTAMAQLILAVVHGTIVAAVVDPGHTDEAAIGAQFAQLLLGARTTPRSR
ncbi:MAG: TetR/AcrR family transcriptional regulator [Ilumatobacteraceae bacterium]